MIEDCGVFATLTLVLFQKAEGTLKEKIFSTARRLIWNAVGCHDEQSWKETTWGT